MTTITNEKLTGFKENLEKHRLLIVQTAGLENRDVQKLIAQNTKNLRTVISNLFLENPADEETKNLYLAFNAEFPVAVQTAKTEQTAKTGQTQRTQETLFVFADKTGLTRKDVQDCFRIAVSALQIAYDPITFFSLFGQLLFGQMRTQRTAFYWTIKNPADYVAKMNSLRTLREDTQILAKETGLELIVNQFPEIYYNLDAGENSKGIRYNTLTAVPTKEYYAKLPAFIPDGKTAEPVQTEERPSETVQNASEIVTLETPAVTPQKPSETVQKTAEEPKKGLLQNAKGKKHK